MPQRYAKLSKHKNFSPQILFLFPRLFHLKQVKALYLSKPRPLEGRGAHRPPKPALEGLYLIGACQYSPARADLVDFAISPSHKNWGLTYVARPPASIFQWLMKVPCYFFGSGTPQGGEGV